MDSKLRTNPTDEEELPPPAYSDSSYATYAPSAPAPTSQYYSSQIQTQLSYLTTQISSVQTRRELASNAQDEKILSLLTNDIQVYLSDLAMAGLKRGTLILVPAKALEDEKALPSDFEFTESDEFNRVVRVRDKEGESSGQTQTWYWCDEDMANRLADSLRPQSDPRTLKLPPRKEEIKAKTEAGSSRGFWGLKKGGNAWSSPSPDERRLAAKVNVEGGKDMEDRVEMEVKAEEVVFRTQNDFGIWNTESGYAIVVKLKVVLTEK